MPVYRADEFEIEVSRHAALLDTNVLVAAFLDADHRHEDAAAFLEIWDDQFLVPVSVVIETWGMLSARDSGLESRDALLAWLSNPGSRLAVLPEVVGRFAEVPNLVRKLRVGCVDAFLLCLASDLTEKCALNPPVLIATFDIRDFWRCACDGEFRFKLLHPATCEEYDLA